MALLTGAVFSKPQPTQAVITEKTYINGKIAYSAYSNGGSDIWLRDSDGSNPVKITSESSLVGSPSWLPDGKKLVYSSDQASSNVADIYIINSDGTGRVNLTNSPSRDEVPEVSPDGTKIAYVQSAGGGAPYYTYVMNIDGSSPTLISNSSSGSDRGPTWSPDGKKVAYENSRTGYSQIYVYDFDTQVTTQLTNIPNKNQVFPDWSTDGSKIAFSSSLNSAKQQIYTMNSNGSSITPLFLCESQASLYPTWSPDGKKILFISGCTDASTDSDSREDLFIMNSDGTNKTNVSNDPLIEQWTTTSWHRIPVTRVITQDDGKIEIDIDYEDYDYDVYEGEILNVKGKVGKVHVHGEGILKGNGHVGHADIYTGGKLSPGESPGCLSSGNLTFVAGSTYDFEVAGPTACTEYDQTKVTGTVTLGNGTLNTILFNNFKPVKDQSYMIIENDGSDAVSGTFLNLAEGATFTVGGYVLKISYVGGTGNDVVLTVQSVPAVPDTGMALFLSKPWLVFAQTSALALLMVLISRKYRSVSRR